MDLKEFTESKTFTGVLYGLGIAVVGLLIFEAGVHVGYERAGFGAGRGEMFYQAFGDRGTFVMGVRRDDFENGHGAAGKIVKVDLPTFIVEGPDNTEKVVRIGEDTVIRAFRDSIAPDALETGNFVVVLGSPNANAEVEAKLIRVVPMPQEFGSSTNSLFP